MTLAEYRRRKLHERGRRDSEYDFRATRAKRIRIARHLNTVHIRMNTRLNEQVRWCIDHLGCENGEWMTYLRRDFLLDDWIHVFVFVDPDAAFEFKMRFG